MPVSAAAEATKELLDAAYILPGLIGASLRPAGLGSAQYTTPGIASTAMEMSIRVNTLHYIGTRREVGLTDRVYSVSFVGGTLALTEEAVSQMRAAIVTADLDKRIHHCHPCREKHTSVQRSSQHESTHQCTEVRNMKAHPSAQKFATWESTHAHSCARRMRARTYQHLHRDARKGHGHGCSHA